MSDVNARIVHFHQDVGAGEVQVIGRGLCVRRHPHRRPRQVIGRHPLMRRLHDVYAGQARHARPVPRRGHAQNGSVLRGRLRQHRCALRLQRRNRVVLAARKKFHVQSRSRRQRPVQPRQQRRGHLVIRLVRRYRKTVAGDVIGRRAVHHHQVGVVGDVGDDPAPRRSQHGAEGGADPALGLYQVSSRIA